KPCRLRRLERPAGWTAAKKFRRSRGIGTTASPGTCGRLSTANVQSTCGTTRHRQQHVKSAEKVGSAGLCTCPLGQRTPQSKPDRLKRSATHSPLPVCPRLLALTAFRQFFANISNHTGRARQP